jgi:acetyltransferase-like isoleucine patch superfamily enzyme
MIASPKLSICIITYNRSKWLINTIESIIKQIDENNQNLIEIIISDNCSTDDTREVVTNLAAHFKWLLYKRNQENIGADLNIERAIKCASGDLILMHNDNFPFVNGSINYILQLIEVFGGYQNKKPLLIFTNKNEPNPFIQINEINDYIKNVSFLSGWLSAFSIWKSDYEEIVDFSNYASKQLVTSDVMLRLFASGRQGLCINVQLFYGEDVGPKGGYNLATVFAKNYLELLQRYRDKEILSNEIYCLEKRKVFIEHILKYCLDKNHNFFKFDFMKEMKEYWEEDYFQEIIDAKLGIEVEKSKKTEKIINEKIIIFEREQINLNKKKKGDVKNSSNELWRTQNKHNQTFIVNAFDFKKVSVGNYSYGPLNILTWDNEKEFLKIGNFVSIAANVTFILGGNHELGTISTFPFGAILFQENENQAKTKGAIHIQDDVWIGHGATILSGITVSQGAVIGAQSVVTKDVEPYTIVAGNPAKVIGKRFDTEVIKQLMNIDYSKIDLEFIQKNHKLLTSEFDFKNMYCEIPIKE